MTQNLEKEERFTVNIKAVPSDALYLRLRKGLHILGILLALLGSSIFTNYSVSAQTAELGTNNFCTKTTYYGGILHCQIGDKTTLGWHDKTIPKQVPPIASLRILNFNNNPATEGYLTIYTQQLYCTSYWEERIGHGYVEINGQRFATCKGDQYNLGTGGRNNGAKYLFENNMVRIITNIKVIYGQTKLIKIYGKIYTDSRNDCRKSKNGMCEYPGISSGWIFSYAKTDSTRTDALANFYKTRRFNGTKRIYDFLTIKYADMDLDSLHPDYYDFDDLSMTLALAEK